MSDITSRRPNIVFILVDDLGWMDLSCQGSTFYQTPNIDRIARMGMTFTDAYAACPVCSPTRASVMSGKYPARVGVTQFIGGAGRGRLLETPYVDHLPLSEVSLARALQEGGYQTWHVGKWHLGSVPYFPEKHGFDVNIGGCERGSPGSEGYFHPWGLSALQNLGLPKGTFLDDYLADQAVGLIQRRDTARPFFLNFWTYLVHTPLQAKQELIDKYMKKAADLGLPADVLEPGELHPVEHKRHIRVMRRRLQSHPVYAAMVEILDQNVGKLIDALEQQGILDQTMIVFTSDNGGLATSEGSPTCNAPLSEGKGWMYEGGVREPLLISWPGVIEPGSVAHEPVTSPDFYPTLLESAGLPLRPGQHEDGFSFLPLLRGEKHARPEPLFWHYPHYSNQGDSPAAAIRMGDWKLIEHFETGRCELYNLRDDVGEDHDLAGQEPRRAAQLHARLKAWQEDVEARFPAVNPDYKQGSDPYASPLV